MKKFVQSLSQVVVNLCISFTVAVLIYAAFSRGTLPQGMVWQLLLLSAAATLLQFAFFRERWSSACPTCGAWSCSPR